ncbi:hypothetical protein NPS46_04375 [Pseudomonas putida]|uniref:hypothetical protein n=1 Tax=Pseudomonas putida TaxID=303 RepID=UPI002364371C|nr:hypothetical protein [Pseudomonas putida]MDD2051785.1 hypothetical protein [Pseudomonas putida]
MSQESRKSSPENRLDAMVEALIEANKKARQHSHCPLNRMPEFFLATNVAEYFATHFINFGYRLEASVKGTLADGGVPARAIERLLEDKELRGNGRFDLVLRTGRRDVPAHVVEFKRGSRHGDLLEDLVRLAYVCETVRAGARLETNYLVFTTRRSEEELAQMLARQERDRKSVKHLRHGVSYRLGRYQVIDRWMNTAFEMTDKPLAVAIFEVRFKG